MGTVRYTVVDGEVISEKRGGVRRQYVPDPLGSTIALLDGSQSQTDTFTYWPYGEEKSRTGTTPTPFRFVGTWGYYRDSATRNYVRARYLDATKTRWISKDPIGFDGGDWNLYRYVKNRAVLEIDPSGQRTLHPCRFRTLTYCGSACYNDGKNHAENCICRVSHIICNVITNPNVRRSEREQLDCVNKCMFLNWKRRGRKFPQADQVCRDKGVESRECCRETIRAEQEGLTFCNLVVCKVGRMPSFGIFNPRAPEKPRTRWAQHLCCKTGRSMGDPLPPGYPHTAGGYE